MEGPPLGPGGEDITWADQVAPRGRKASSNRKIKPQTSNLLFDDLYAVTLCGTFFSVMHFVALLCWCLREASRKEGVPKNASCRAACNMGFENWFSKRLKAHGCFYYKA